VIGDRSPLRAWLEQEHRAVFEPVITRIRFVPSPPVPLKRGSSAGKSRRQGVVSSPSSVARSRVPCYPLRPESPGGDLRLDRVHRGAHPVGSRAAGLASTSTGVMPRHGRPSGLRLEARVENEFDWFVGVDWATAAHRCSVQAADGTTVADRVVEHTATGISAFLDWMTERAGGSLARVAVAIEVPRGAVVETMLERGAAVFTLNPKQVDRFRDRISVAGAKDDSRDAWVLGSALRTDQHCFRRVQVDDPRIIHLREVARADEDLAHEMNRLTNRLREQVLRVAPQWLALAPGAGEPWFWALLERAPTPAAAARLKPKAIEALLRAHRIRRLTASDVQAALRAPLLHVAPGTREAAATHIALLLPRLRLVHAQRAECRRQLEQLLEAIDRDPPGAAAGADPANTPSDARILRSLPGVGRVVAATLLAEAAGLLAARDYRALRAHSGIAPVTRQSGTRRVVNMRHACSGRLRHVCYHWARTSVLCDEAARHYYAALRARGHSHGRALRSVADRWLRILMAMLASRTLYSSDYTPTPCPT
jgi:transposase